MRAGEMGTGAVLPGGPVPCPCPELGPPAALPLAFRFGVCAGVEGPACAFALGVECTGARPRGRDRFEEEADVPVPVPVLIPFTIPFSPSLRRLSLSLLSSSFSLMNLASFSFSPSYSTDMTSVLDPTCAIPVRGFPLDLCSAVDAIACVSNLHGMSKTAQRESAKTHFIQTTPKRAPVALSTCWSKACKSPNLRKWARMSDARTRGLRPLTRMAQGGGGPVEWASCCPYRQRTLIIKLHAQKRTSHGGTTYTLSLTVLTLFTSAPRPRIRRRGSLTPRTPSLPPSVLTTSSFSFSFERLERSQASAQ